MGISRLAPGASERSSNTTKIETQNRSDCPKVLVSQKEVLTQQRLKLISILTILKRMMSERSSNTTKIETLYPSPDMRCPWVRKKF